ncbi:MAG TPA: diphthine--ammonia ligase [Firmicutes bacterium]|nr:diphthine--ammonia ligase [Bacillota bacterium]
MDCFVSWSGGKDSCLAYWKARQEGLAVRYALTMHDRGVTAAHGLPLRVVEKQVKSLGLELVAVDSGWDDYEDNFKKAVSGLANRGVVRGVFGDIDLEEHRRWVERVCEEAGVAAELPLWGAAQEDLLMEWVEGGFRAVITAVNSAVLDLRWLGRPLDRNTVEELIVLAKRQGFSPSGEAGEYHTLVLGGPPFQTNLAVERATPCYASGYWKLEVSDVSSWPKEAGSVESVL